MVGQWESEEKVAGYCGEDIAGESDQVVVRTESGVGKRGKDEEGEVIEQWW